jgi:hypothetical protein
VPESFKRWAASGTSALMKPSCVGMCKDKPTQTIVQPNGISGKEIPEYAGGRRARNAKSFFSTCQRLVELQYFTLVVGGLGKVCRNEHSLLLHYLPCLLH